MCYDFLAEQHTSFGLCSSPQPQRTGLQFLSAALLSYQGDSKSVFSRTLAHGADREHTLPVSFKRIARAGSLASYTKDSGSGWLISLKMVHWPQTDTRFSNCGLGEGYVTFGD